MSKLLKWIDENQFKDTLPIFYKLVRLLSTNPATSCTTGHSVLSRGLSLGSGVL